LSARPLTSGILTCLLLIFLNGSSKFVPSASAQQSAGSPKIVRSSAGSIPTVKTADLPAPVFAPPGTELYSAKRRDSIASVARQFVRRTSYLTSSELAEAIRQSNHRSGNNLKAGDQVIIPSILPAPIVEKTIPVARDFEVRAIYLTG